MFHKFVFKQLVFVMVFQHLQLLACLAINYFSQLSEQLALEQQELEQFEQEVLEQLEQQVFLIVLEQ
jgi:hypothetical protein